MFANRPTVQIMQQPSELLKFYCHRDIHNVTITSFATTGSTLALHCCKAHTRINRKMQNSTPCKIVTPENFSSKVCTRDYVEDGNCCTNFGKNRLDVASPQVGEIGL